MTSETVNPPTRGNGLPLSVTATDTTPGLADRAVRSARLRPQRAAPDRAARNRRKWYEIIGLTTPAVVIYVVFVLLPMGFAVFYSLFRWRGAGWPSRIGCPLNSPGNTTVVLAPDSADPRGL